MASEDGLSLSTTRVSTVEQRVDDNAIRQEQAAAEVITWPRRVQPYTPLHHESHVRLLHIDNAWAYTADCSLWEYSWSPLMENAYYALSYCWGDKLPTRIILINGQPFAVTLNLLRALRSIKHFTQKPNILSKLFSTKDSHLVWIDAICLNQADDKEKSVQIQRMGEIYSRAKKVLVWLGPKFTDFKIVMLVFKWLEARDFIEKIDTGETLGNWRTRDVQVISSILDEYALSCERSLNEETGARRKALEALYYIWKSGNSNVAEELVQRTVTTRKLFGPGGRLPRFEPAFLSLMNHPWFTRVWTLQEILLAKDARLLCGAESVSWSICAHMRKIFYQHGSDRIDYLLSGITSAHVPGARFLGNIGERPPYSEEEKLNAIGLFQHILWNNFGIRRARDPRDFVYGLFGILDHEIRAQLQVNYELSASQVYAMAFKVISEETDIQGCRWHLMSFLEMFGRQRGNPDSHLPSWCPDLSAAPKDALDAVTMFWGTQRFSRRDADKFHPPMLPMITNDMHMRTSAIMIDEIDYALDFCPPENQREDFQRAQIAEDYERLWHCDYTLECHRWLYAMYTIIQRLDVDSLAENINWLWHVIWQTDNDEKTISNEAIIEVFRKGMDTSGLAEDLPLLTRRNLQKYTHIPAVLTIYALVLNCGKYFLVTEKGRIGFSQKPTQRGDQVCYIPGGQVLQILSRRCDSYITSATMHGLTGDDALLEAVGSDPVWTTVTLH